MILHKQIHLLLTFLILGAQAVTQIRSNEETSPPTTSLLQSIGSFQKLIMYTMLTTCLFVSICITGANVKGAILLRRDVLSHRTPFMKANMLIYEPYTRMSVT